MRKTAVYFGATTVVLMIVSSLTTAFFLTRQLKAQTKTPESSLTKSMNGLPLHGPVREPVPLPMLTRDDLVTRGHAEDKAEIADLFYTYIFYHDSHNGPGVASLFTNDGILETLWNDHDSFQ